MEGEWRWQESGSDGDLFWKGGSTGYSPDRSFQNWEASNPDNFGGNQDHLVLRTNGDWDDAGSSASLGYITEWNAHEVLDATQALTYSVHSQTVAGAFEVDADSGEIRVADGTLLDYETNTSHTVTIRTTDVDGNTYDEAFTISLNNLIEDNNAPTNLSSGIELNTDGGNNAYLETTNGSAIIGGLSQFTLESKVSFADDGQQIIFSYSTTTYNDGLQLQQANNHLRFVINDSIIDFTAIDYSTLLDGQIRDIAVSWDNTNGDVAVYIDGELIETATGFATGEVIDTDASSSITFGMDTDVPSGSYQSFQTFRGTHYDVRLWNEVRSEAEISLNYRQKFDSGSLPTGLIANWQMDGFNGSNQVVDVVSGNNLSIGHATGTGFIASTPVEDLHVSEIAPVGTSVGFVVPSDPDAPKDIVSDGLFLETTVVGSFATYTVGQTFGGWTVTQDNVDVASSSGFELTPSGGQSVDLSGVNGAFGTISQSLSTEVGREYQVVFSFSGNWSGGDDAKHLRASAGGDSHDFAITQPAGWAGSNMLWSDRSFTFTADSTTTDLSFAEMIGDGFGAVLGDIRVIEIPQAVSTILNNDPTLSYDAATGKFYRLVSTITQPLTAVDAANSATINGVSGQLATIRSEYENELIRSYAEQVGGDILLGGRDATTEGNWYFLDGSSESEQFSTGSTATNGYYTNWRSSEPNGSTSENHLAIGTDGQWFDVPDNQNRAYIIEWDASEVLSNFTFSLTDDAGGRFAIDSSTGEITVADGSLLDYETATSHNVTVETTDAAGNTYSESMAISIDNGLDALQTVPAAQAINEDTTLTFTSGTATEVSITDTLGGTNSRMRVNLSVNDGVLTLSQTTGLTFVEGANGSGSLVIDGTESDINAALDGMTFTPDQHFNGSVTLNMETTLAADLEGHYTFAGGNANDQGAGTAQNCSFVGGATTTVDPDRGEVLSLDGDGDRVQFNTETFGDPQSATLSLWVNVTGIDTGGGTYIELGSSIGIWTANFGAYNMGVQAFAYDGTTFQTTGTTENIIGTGWRHLAMTHDSASNSLKLYLDGELIAQATTTGPVNYGVGQSSVIGGHTSLNRDIAGQIDDARIYSRALSADEIAAMVAEQPVATIGPDLTQAFGTPAGDSSGQNLLFIHDQYAPITGHGTISSLQIGPDSNGTPIDFDLMVLRPNGGGGFEIIHRVSLTDSDVISTDGDGVRTLNIGKLDVQAGDVIGHWSANNAGSIPYTIGSGGATGWSSYATGDVEVGDTVTEGNTNSQERVYGIAFDFTASEPSSYNQVAITVGAVNDQPTFSSLDGNPTFFEGGSPVVMDADASFFDVDIDRGEDNFDSVNLVLQRQGGANAEDVFTATGNVVFQVNNDVDVSGTTVGTIIGNSGGLLNIEFNATATQAQVNEVLQSIAYSNSSTSPPSSITINWSMEDSNGGSQGSGGNQFATGSTVVNIVDVPNPADVVVPIAQSVNEDTPLTFSVGGGNAITVDGGSSYNPIVTVTLSVNDGDLTLAGTTGITFLDGTSNGSATLTISGTEADINAALDGLQYQGDLNFNGSDTLTVTTGSNATVEANLHARYEFLNGSLEDETTNDFDGVAVGNPSLTTDLERGDVLTFDGDDRINVASSVSTLGHEVTIAAWVNLSAGQQDNVFLSIGDEIYVMLDKSSGGSMGLTVSNFSTNSLNAAHNIAGEGWNHIAATVDNVAKEVRLYLNGELIHSSSFAFANIDWSSPNSPNITIGALSDGSSAFTGSLDDVRVYNSELTQSEIIAVMGDNGYDSETVGLTVNAVNDAPVVTAPGLAYSFTEQGSLNIHGTGFGLADVDENGGSMTATFTVGEGRLLINAGDSGVTVASGSYFTSGNGTDTVTFTGTKAQLNALLSGSSTGTIVYYSAQSEAGDAPAPTTTITLTVNDQGNTGSDPGLTGDGSSEEQFAAQTINVTAVNNVPRLLGPDLITNGHFTTDLSGWTATNIAYHSVDHARFGGGNVAGPHSLSQTIATTAGETYVLEFDYRDDNGTTNQQLQVTVDGSANLLTTEQILTDTDGSTFVRYRYTFTADSASATLTFTDTSDDVGSQSAASGGVDGRLDNVSVRQTGGQLGTTAFTEGGAAVVLDSDVTLFDAEISAALDDFSGTSILLVRNGGANADDVFSATGALGALSQAGSLTHGGTTIGTVTTNSGGTLLLTFNSNATESLVNSTLQSIVYSNTSDAPPASVQIDWTFNDNNDGSQGSGGTQNANGFTVVNITGVNDDPVLTQAPGGGTYRMDRERLLIPPPPLPMSIVLISMVEYSQQA